MNGAAVAARIKDLQGWHALLVSYLAGASMVLGFAPFFFWPVIFISLPLGYWVLSGATTLRNAAWRGFFFGYGYFMAGTYWIANSMLVDVAKFGWMMPFSILGLSAALAIYFALFGALVYWTRRASALTSLLRFAVLWVVVEYLRSIGAYGFAWNLAGYITLASPYTAQAASVIGTFGLSLLVLLAGLAPVWLAEPSHRLRAWAWLLPVLIVAGLYGYGLMRMPAMAGLTETRVRIVQPSIPQTIKHTPEGQLRAMEALIGLSIGASHAPLPDITVWPETAYPKTLRALQTHLVWPFSGLLVTGAVAVDGEGEGLRIYNSVAAIDPASTVLARYNKHQLVPFGEFVPLRSVLPLSKITPGDLDFSRGKGAETVILDRVPPFSPLVCYEVVFPWMAVNRHTRPSWIVNVTNDGWYGNSPGPYQHFAMTRMRAIEQGLPLVRAANTGISAMIDPYGRAIASLGLDERGILDIKLPAALPSTLYARFGEWLTLLLLILLWSIPYFRSVSHEK